MKIQVDGLDFPKNTPIMFVYTSLFALMITKILNLNVVLGLILLKFIENTLNFQNNLHHNLDSSTKLC